MHNVLRDWTRGECEGLSPDQQDQDTEALETTTEIHKRSLDNLLDSAV
ncbi:hypothetical protein [Streptomyces sp. NBC_01483]|nr:hypothetical protein [Streptomyces sp. NBC_01483]